MATLGQKLRELRQQKGYKLNQVAKGADLSISFVSLIERDKASISVENLKKLANFYNVRLFQIFQDIEEENAYIVKKEELNEWESMRQPNQITLFLLSPEENLSFKAILAMIPPGSFGEFIQLKQGETFIHVMAGQLEISLPNKGPLVLNQGDSAHLTSFKETLLRNFNLELPLRLLIVVSTTTQYLDKHGNPLICCEHKG